MQSLYYVEREEWGHAQQALNECSTMHERLASASVGAESGLHKSMMAELSPLLRKAQFNTGNSDIKGKHFTCTLQHTPLTYKN